jgi:uncharacterized protein
VSGPVRRPLPPITPDTKAWWEATRDRRLVVQRCRHCGHHQHYPRDLCTACAGADLELVPAGGRGTVYSFTVVHRAPGPPFDPPYVVALVRLDEGPQVLTNIVGCEPSEVRCDQPVTVSWEPLDDGRHLPVFTPA